LVRKRKYQEEIQLADIVEIYSMKYIYLLAVSLLNKGKNDSSEYYRSSETAHNYSTGIDFTDMSKRNSIKRKLSAEQSKALLSVVKGRFENHMNRHNGMDWTAIETKLKASPEREWSLHEMERTGGEPDVVAYDKKTGEYIFMDCALESPKGHRSICYDPEALESRKENKPGNSALGMADAMGIELLSEEQYRALQKLGTFDAKTSSWIRTPADIRKHGGAIFADWRYGHVSVYHNGAESYYAARGFRGLQKV
jgi:hypothetical protein